MSDRGERVTDTREPSSEEFHSLLKRIAHASDRPVDESSAELFEVGQTLAGDRFTVGAHIGHGGMGSIWRVWDERDQREVALKTLLGRDPSRLVRLKNEFRSLADIRHRNLVELYELHADGEHWFFTMELVRGTGLLNYVRPGGRLSLDRTRRAFGELAQGLAALHSNGLVHRDVKPSNILVEADGRVVLLDFGLVAERRRRGERRPRKILGTAAYMSPEQASGAEPTAGADLYSLGVVLYQALVGALPAKSGAAAPPGPTDLAELCSRLRSDEPSARGSVEDVIEALSRFAATRAPRSPATRSRPGRFSRPVGDDWFVGRGPELAELDRALGRGPKSSAVAVVRGESGIGKSALLHQFASRARAAGARVYISRCREREHVPFNAVDGISTLR